MDKLLKYLAIIAICTLTFLVRPAFASHGNPDILSIISASKYQNVELSGDALFVVRYAMLYTVTPTEPINETTVGRILDVGGLGTLGIVNITANNPIPDLGYSHGIFSFYFQVEPVPTGVLTVEISPNPSDDPPSSSSATKTTFTIGTRDSLVVDLRLLASALETIWEEDIIDFATGSGKFTLTGADYFNAAIPNLNQYAPDLFILGSITVDPSVYVDPVDFTYRDSLSTFWDNTPVGTFFIETSASIGIPRKALELIAVLAFNFAIGAFVFWRWRDPEPAIMVAALGLVVSGILGLGYLEFVYAIAALAALTFFIRLFFVPSGA